MTEFSPVVGNFFWDSVIAPLREWKLGRFNYQLTRDVTYRRPHTIEYGPFLTWWSKFIIGNQETLTEANSWPDVVIPLFGRGSRSGSNLGEAWYLDPVWGGPRAHGIDHTQYDFAQQHISESGKYWKVLMFPEKVWRNSMMLNKDVNVDHAPPGLLRETPSVDHDVEATYPWRKPEVRRWPPAHGHH